MTFAFENLDERTRAYMKEEFAHDVEQDTVYLSPRLNETGRSTWNALVEEVFTSHDEDWFAAEIQRRSLLITKETYNAHGKQLERKVPQFAHEMMAHGAFNHYYVRAICRVAIEIGDDEVEIYRAKEVQTPRASSESRIGTRLDPTEALEALRQAHHEDSNIPVPSGPNSGLSLRLVSS